MFGSVLGSSCVAGLCLTEVPCMISVCKHILWTMFIVYYLVIDPPVSVYIFSKYNLYYSE